MKIVLILSAVMVLGGCATPGSDVVLEGATTSDPKLRADTMLYVQTFVNGAGCANVDKVVTAIVEGPTGEPLSHITKENWVAHGCGKTFPFDIQYKGDGEGGTFIGVTRLW